MDASTVKYKISSNIKSLREARGETQSQLGAALGVTKQAINSYEIGDKVPPLRRVIDIANHYDISIDRFLHSFISVPDCSNVYFSYERIMSTMDVMLPVFDIQCGQRDEDYLHGVKQHLIVMRQLKADGYVYGFDAKAESIFEAYVKSIELNKSCESAANALSLIILLWVCTNKSNVEKAAQLVSSISDFPYKVFGDVIESMQLSTSRDMEFCKDFEPIILELINLLKADSRWYEIGDYYFALRFFLGLVDCDSDCSVLREVGTEMLISYCSMGNERAYMLLQDLNSY